MHNTEAVTDLVKCLSKPCVAVRHVQLDETEQRVLFSPLPNSTLLDPVAGDCEVSVGVINLPCIACQADFAAHGRALTSEH